MQQRRQAILINPFAMQADHAHLLQMLAEAYQQKTHSDSAIGIVKRDSRYAVTMPTLDFDAEPEKKHVKFTHDIRLHPHTLIDPTNLNAASKNLLLQLLNNMPSAQFFECTDPISRDRVTYHLVTEIDGCANLHLIQLTHTLIRYFSKKHPDTISYAVVKRDAYAQGARHAIYLSKHTLHVTQRDNKYIDVQCTRKSDKEKYRAVKRPYLPADDRRQIKMTATGMIDRSEQNQRLQHESTMMQRFHFFHVKPVIMSNCNSSLRSSCVM